MSNEEKLYALAERFVVALESIALALQPVAPGPAEFEEFELERDDEVNPEIIATMELMEANGQRIPDEVYKEWKLEPPDRSLKPEIDASTFDRPQSELLRPKEPAREPAPISAKPELPQ